MYEVKYTDMEGNLEKLKKIRESLEKKKGITKGKGYEKIAIEKNEEG